MATNIFDMTNFALDTGFEAANTQTPICGHLEQPYLQYSQWAKVDVDGLVSGDLILVKNALGAAGSTTGIAGLNDQALSITQKAIDQPTASGVILETDNYVIENNNLSIPLLGGSSIIGLFGSGVETFLPCVAALQNISLGGITKFEFNFTTGEIQIFSAGVEMPITIMSSVVDGYVKKNTAGVITLEPTLCVRVKL